MAFGRNRTDKYSYTLRFQILSLMTFNGTSLLKASEVQEISKGGDLTFYSRLLLVDQRFSTFFNSWHTEQHAKIVKAHRQFFL
jgi:hypothetical protein